MNNQDMKSIKLPQEELSDEIRATCQKLYYLLMKANELCQSVIRESNKDGDIPLASCVAAVNVLGPYIVLMDHLQGTNIREVHASFREALNEAGAIIEVNKDVK